MSGDKVGSETKKSTTVAAPHAQTEMVPQLFGYNV